VANIERFEHIGAWQKARVLTREVYVLTRDAPACRDFRYIDQIRSASCSIMSNIVEGFERDGNAELKQFLYVAKASAGEVRSQLYVGLDVGYFTVPDFQRLMALVTEVVRMVAGFIRYLEQSELKGRKYADRNPN